MTRTARPEPLDVESIIAASEGVLRRHGPEKATVVDVARVLGVSHGSVYRHFPSKAALREAVVRRWLARIGEELDRATRDHGPTATDRLRGLLTSMFALKWARANDDPELFATFSVLAAEHSDVSAAHVDELRNRIRDIVADGVTAGELVAAEPAGAARAVLDATTRFHSPSHAAEWQDPGIEADAAAVVALVLRGLQAR